MQLQDEIKKIEDHLKVYNRNKDILNYNLEFYQVTLLFRELESKKFWSDDMYEIEKKIEECSKERQQVQFDAYISLETILYMLFELKRLIAEEKLNAK